MDEPRRLAKSVAAVRETMSTLYLFADSNLFLQYRPLDQLDWSRLGNFDDMEVVVCRTVQ